MPNAKKAIHSKRVIASNKPTLKQSVPKQKTWNPKEIIEDAKRKVAGKATSLTAGDSSTDTIDPVLLAKMKNQKPPVISEDKLDVVRAHAKKMRELTLQIKAGEDAIAEKKQALHNLSSETLPDLFNEYNMSSITIGKEGNYPAMTLESKPFYKAVLPKESDAGLRWLEKKGHGDLIKRVVTVKLPMKSQKQADQLRKLIQKLDLAYTEEETVPWTTLTAFVKEMIEKRGIAVPLEILGAVVGTVVKIKKEKVE